MKRIWLYAFSGLLAPLALAFATPAVAQAVRSNSSRPSMSARSEATPSETGAVQGTVRSIDFRNGILRISSGNRLIYLHAKPDQLTAFQPGDQVNVDYDDFAGVLWLSGETGGAAGPAGSVGAENFALSGTVSGTVAALDKARGRVTLTGAMRNHTFLAHPDDIRTLIPGQFVSLTYERIGNTDWVSSIGQGGSEQPAPEEK